MLPRRPAQLFRSRWSALWWSFTVIVGAVLSIGPGESTPAAANATDATGQVVSQADAKALEGLLKAQ